MFHCFTLLYLWLTPLLLYSEIAVKAFLTIRRDRYWTSTLKFSTAQLHSLAMSNGSGVPPGDSRLLLVSNRLPITIRRSESGKYEFSMSSGGLVTGLSGLSKTTTFQWYGWPGLEVPEDEITTVTQQLQEQFNATPVFMDDKLADRHYNGFSSAFSRLPK